MAARAPSTSSVSEDELPTTPRRSPRKRSQPNSPKDGTKAKRASLSFMAESQEQSDFIIKPLRELATKLYPYVGEKHVYLLTHLLELNRQSIEQSQSPLLAFMEAAEESGRIRSNNVNCLINGLEKLPPCKDVTQAIDKIKAYKKRVESENVSDLTSPVDTSKNKTAESHWQNFKEWCHTTGRIACPEGAKGRDVTDYLERLYPNIKVVTIRKHYASIKKHLRLNTNEDEHILQFLNKLSIKEKQKH